MSLVIEEGCALVPPRQFIRTLGGSWGGSWAVPNVKNNNDEFVLSIKINQQPMGQNNKNSIKKRPNMDPKSSPNESLGHDFGGSGTLFWSCLGGLGGFWLPRASCETFWAALG